MPTALSLRSLIGERRRRRAGTGSRCPRPGCDARISRAARMPSSVWVGGIRMSTIATSGRMELTLSRRSSRRRALCHDFEAGFGQQSCDAFAHQHASSARTTRKGSRPAIGPVRGQAADAQGPVEGLDAVSEAAQTRATGEVRSADAVVDDLDDQRARHSSEISTLEQRRPGVLRDVGQRLGDEVIRGYLDRRGQAVRRCEPTAPQVRGARAARDSRATASP